MNLGLAVRNWGLWGASTGPWPHKSEGLGHALWRKKLVQLLSNMGHLTVLKD